MKRIEFTTSSHKKIQRIGDELVIGRTYRLKPDSPGARFGNWPKKFTIIEFQEKYFDGIKPDVEVVDLCAEKKDYFPRVVGRNERGKKCTMHLGVAKPWFENGQMRNDQMGALEWYEPL